MVALRKITASPRHTAVLRGLAVGGAPTPEPLILERRDQDFINALLDELSRPGGVDRLGGRRVLPAAGSLMRLYQPIHRVFNLVLFELDCKAPGQPPIPRERIESAGLVVRRVWTNGQARLAEAAQAAAASRGGQKGKNRTSRQLAEFIAARSRGSQKGAFEDSAAPQIEVIDLSPVISDRSASGITVRDRRGEQAALEGWMLANRSLRGWLPILSSAEDLDPDPNRRPGSSSGHPVIDQLLREFNQTSLAEEVTPLFVAPPEVCAAAGRTILFGLVPVTSLDQSEVDQSIPPLPLELVDAHLPAYLRAGGPYAVPSPGRIVNYEDARASRTLRIDANETDDLGDFIRLLNQVGIELDMFGTSPTSRRLFNAVNAIQLSFRVSAIETYTQAAAEFLRDAFDVLVQAKSGLPALRMPEGWPEVSPDQAAEITAAAGGTIGAQLGKIASREGRYDDPARTYCLRAFVRLKMPAAGAGCPPELVWSEYSHEYSIIPWYESSGAPPIQVNLPDVTDPNYLKNLKPNVSFTVPAGLFNLLNRNSPDDFIKGSASQSGGVVLDWICSFNIPVITICAFIVLNIFLSLFDLFLHWMMFIKICIPFPRPKPGP